ncbi:MAG: beta-ketoacyl-ACP synthase III [Nitrospirota bacterium]
MTAATRSRIVGTGSYVPERVMTNADIERLVETSDQWIVERTGIRERRIADPSEATSDLAAAAATRALEAAGVHAPDLDLVLVATATPDMLFPATACLVQARLGAKRAFAFDLSAACTGFLYGLSVADQYLRSGAARTVLLVGAEVLSRVTDWTDRATCILFGDGAGAVVLRAERGERGVLSTHIHADGSMWDFIHVPGGGSRHPPSEDTLVRGLQFLRMKGSETFKVAVRTLEETSLEALKANGLTIADVRWLIPHQANRRIIEAVGARLGLPPERVVMNLERVGNTSAASIPIALDELIRRNGVNADDILLFAAFGAGLTWGSAAVRW